MATWYFLGGLALLIIFYFWKRSGQASAAEIEAMLAEGALVIDVRTAAEFKGGHFPGAMNLPVESIKANLKKVGAKDKPVILYCASGMRSGMALRTLKANGYEQAVNAGGYHGMMNFAK